MTAPRTIDGAFLILALSAASIAALSFPGHVHFDALRQLLEGTTGEWKSFNPPVLSALWAQLFHTVDEIWPLLLIQNLCFFVALWILVRGVPHFRAIGIAGLLLIAFWPPVVNFQGVIVKDVAFACLTLLAFALLHIAAVNRRVFESPLRAIITAGVSLVLLALAAHARQQGLFSLIIGAATWIYLLTRWRGGDAWAWRATFMPAIIVGGFLMALMSGLSQMPQLVTDKTPNLDFRAGIYLIMRYDMAGILFHAPRADPSVIKESGFDRDLLMQAVKETYTGERTDYFDARVEDTYDLNVIYTTGVNGGVPAFDDYFRHMKQIWLDLVVHQPKAYLAHRLESFAWLLGLRDESKCIPVFVGVPDGMGIRVVLGLNPPPTSRDSYVFGLFTPLRDTLIYQHWVYLLWTLALLAFVGLTYRAGDEAIFGLGLSALVMTFSFLVLGLACDFRYLYMPMVVGLVLPVMIAGRRPRVETSS